MSKALIAMSGGVDSSVAAAVSVADGLDCLGVTMLLIPERQDVFKCGCTAEEEAIGAREIADKLGIKHRTVRMTADFESLVIKPFVDAYLRGRTPNPCVECNRHIKFSSLLDYADKEGCDFLVTGHYARTEQCGERVYLKRGADEKKDQTYFLWTLTPDKLKRIRFPVGDMTKPEVREIASSLSLSSAEKKDSQDICFVNGNYAELIRRYTGITPPEGDFVDTCGNVIGRHGGIINYTIGQRKGLGVAFGEPMYVTAKDAPLNRVTLGRNEDLFRSETDASCISLCVDKSEIYDGMRISAKIRYNQPPVSAVLHLTGDDSIRVSFDASVRAISPGQSLVFYSDDVVLGGAIID